MTQLELAAGVGDVLHSDLSATSRGSRSSPPRPLAGGGARGRGEPWDISIVADGGDEDVGVEVEAEVDVDARAVLVSMLLSRIASSSRLRLEGGWGGGPLGLDCHFSLAS